MSWQLFFRTSFLIVLVDHNKVESFEAKRKKCRSMNKLAKIHFPIVRPLTLKLRNGAGDKKRLIGWDCFFCFSNFHFLLLKLVKKNLWDSEVVLNINDLLNLVNGSSRLWFKMVWLG